MSTDLSELTLHWKQAATQEGVDYGAVQKSFMDQSYGVVANKAKILFQDPFRLGFEIVHRNEKATKLVGIFAFRVNKKLLYVPTFFVNGEIKPADMLYRADVKRFVPLTEDWCAYLVRGVEEQSGELVGKNRRRQADAYLDRLAYPQRVKYASEEDFTTRQPIVEKRRDDVFVNFRCVGSVDELRNIPDGELQKLANADFEGLEQARDEFVKAARDGSLFSEMLRHCADNSPIRKLLPDVINEFGPEAIEKVAAFVGDSEEAARYLVTHYSQEELETVTGWQEKQASEAPQVAIAIITDPSLAKSAASRERIYSRGYDLFDGRPSEAINAVVEEIESDTIKAIASPCVANVLLDDGSTELAYILREDSSLLDAADRPSPMAFHAGAGRDKPELVYFPASKELLRLRYDQEVFGDEPVNDGLDMKLVSAKSLKTGKCYVAFSSETKAASEVFHLDSKEKDGGALVLGITNSWGDTRKVFYAPDRTRTQGAYISDETQFLEVACEMETDEDSGRTRRLSPECGKVLMSGIGLDRWMRTGGGLTSSSDVKVKAKPSGGFDIEHRVNGTLLKAARDLGMLEAHLALAEDFSMTTDEAGKILDKARDGDVTYRIYNTLSKEAYLTRVESMENWIESFDPELNVRLDAPQYQVLSTFTPKRPNQQSRYGDVYQRVPTSLDKAASALLPMDFVMSQSPEQLAAMSEQYDLPHIFDHACVGQMATTSHNIIDQIKKYIPDLETGLDRYFRILFLLRYRPGDFEEIYGKDDLVEFEDSLTELASRAGDQLLKILQQFSPDQYSAQEN